MVAPGDRRRLAAVVLSFGISLGATTVAFPLLALEAGLGAEAVGLLAALSAALQMAAKALLPYLLSRITDRSLILCSLATMALSAAVLISTTVIAGFLLAQTLQGVARGFFWTTAQTHAVRIPGIATRQLAFIQTVGQMGGLIGPALAGTLAALSLFVALWAAVGLATVGLLLALALEAKPPYPRKTRGANVPIWRRNGVGVGCWAGAVGGVWRGILDSFVPVLLDGAGFSSRTIGWLMSTADASSVAGTAAIARWGDTGMGRFVTPASLGLAAGLVLLPLAGQVVTIALVLILAGFCGGIAGVLGTAAINESIDAGDQGAALALVGVYRAGARTAAPALVSGALVFVALPVALAGAAFAVVAPSLWLRTSGRSAARADDAG